MATSSCEKSATDFNVSALQPSVSEASDDSDCLSCSPSVRAYVASFESQQQRPQHRKLCRTDNVAKLPQRGHERPQPPCKTTKAVLKARHLRAASEDLTKSLTLTDPSQIAVAGRSVVELKVALLNSTKQTSDDDGRRHDTSDDDISFLFASDRQEPISQCPEHTVHSVHCDKDEIDLSLQCGTEANTKRPSSDMSIIPDISTDFSTYHSSCLVDGEVQQQAQPATDGGVDVVDSTGDDVGYYSLPGRKSDRNRHQTARSRSQLQSGHLSHDSGDDDEVESSLIYSSDSTGSVSPGLRNSKDGQSQASSQASSVVSCLIENDSCQDTNEGAQHNVSASPPTTDGCSNHTNTISDNCLSRLDDATYIEHSDKLDADEGNHVDYSAAVFGRNCTSPAKLEPERLSEVMLSSFGRCDDVLCRVVGAVGSHKTAFNYVSGLFPESGLIQQCAFDLTSSCQLDAMSTGVQFLTLEAVREAARSSILQERDKILHVKETMDNEENLLTQLDARVADVIKRKADSRQLEKYRQIVDEMERVTRLLLVLAGRLARLDNTLLQLPPSGDSHPTDTKSLTTNRDKLMEKFVDASTLKSDIDRRGHVISDQLASCLSADELVDYQRLMVEKTRLRLQRQEMDDWLRLADQQLKEISIDIDDSDTDLISHC